MAPAGSLRMHSQHSEIGLLLGHLYFQGVGKQLEHYCHSFNSTCAFFPFLPSHSLH